MKIAAYRHRRIFRFLLFPVVGVSILMGAGCTLGAGEEGRGTAYYEEETVKRVNRLRKSADLPPLAMDERLRGIARAHSLDMVERNFFDHVNPDNADPFARLRANSILYVQGGENIARNNFDDPVSGAIAAWEESPGHYANMMRGSFARTGVGVVEGEEGEFYFTQVFTRPYMEGE